jgi:chromosome segregation ATPase
MFGRSRRMLRAEIRDLEARLDTSRRETRAARGDCGLATRDAETWQRRAVEFSNRVTEVEYQLRDLNRLVHQYERRANENLLPRAPRRPGCVHVLEVAS